MLFDKRGLCIPYELKRVEHLSSYGSLGFVQHTQTIQKTQQ